MKHQTQSDIFLAITTTNNDNKFYINSHISRNYSTRDKDS